MPAFLTRVGRRRVLDPNATVGLKPRTPGGRTLIPATDLTALDVVVSSGKPSKGNVSLQVFNNLPAIGGPPATVDGFTSTGDKFLFTWTAPADGSQVAVERALGVGRKYLQISPNLSNGTTAWGDKVYDLVHPYYRVVALRANGTRDAIASWDATQPVRTNWVGAQTVSTNNVTLQDLNIRVSSIHNVPSFGSTTNAAPAAVKINSNVTGFKARNLFIACTGQAFNAVGNNDIDIQGCIGHALHPGIANSGQAFFSFAANPTSFIARHNHQDGFLGGYLINGNAGQGLQTLSIMFNRAFNLLTAITTATGYLMDALPNTSDSTDHRYFPVGHFVQLNACQRISAGEVAWNEYQGEAGLSSLEDCYSSYKSGGTSGSSLIFHDNMCQGMYLRDPLNGSGYGCCYIHDGASPSADPTLNGYVKFLNNVALDFCNVGMGIYYGVNIEASGNRLLSTGRTPDGSPLYASNQALACYKFGDEIAAGFKGISIHDNVLSNVRTHPTGQYPAGKADSFISIAGTDGSATNNTSLAIQTVANIQTEYQNWQARVRTAGFYTGFYTA